MVEKKYLPPLKIVHECHANYYQYEISKYIVKRFPKSRKKKKTFCVG